MAPSRPQLAGKGGHLHVRTALLGCTRSSGSRGCSAVLLHLTSSSQGAQRKGSVTVCRVLCCTLSRLRRDQQSSWRKEDIEQRHLENARVLWARIVERNRRDVEEKSEQLKAISTLAALISGFALSAFLQFDFCDFQDSTGAALPLFGISLALTVSASGARLAGRR